MPYDKTENSENDFFLNDSEPKKKKMVPRAAADYIRQLKIDAYIFFFQLSNLFFISLAVADLLLSALVMPFAIVNDLTGQWAFGAEYCNLWISTDVMCCTASITSLLAISLER